jgi:Carboxypeptidase regulatory-like domain
VAARHLRCRLCGYGTEGVLEAGIRTATRVVMWWVRIVVATGVLGGLIAVGAGVLAAGQGLEASYSVRGTVVNSVTGEPIQNALVTLSLGDARSVFTASDGSFEFRNVKEAGDRAIFAARPGYFSPQLVRHSRYSISSSTIPVKIGPDQAPLELRLVPEAVIAGRVTGEAGEPIEGLVVRVFFRGAVDGYSSLQEQSGLETDSNGEFRRAELMAGRYIVAFGPGGEPTKTSQGKKAIREGYGAVFYPGVPDLASATAIDVTPGKVQEMDMRMPIVPFFRVSGTVSGIPPEERARILVKDGTGELSTNASTSSQDRGQYHLDPMAAGSYTIEAQFSQGLRVSRSLLLKSDTTGVNLSLLPGASIPVRVKTELDPNDIRVDGNGYTQITRGDTVTTNYGDGRAVNVTFIQRDGPSASRRSAMSTTGSKDQFTMEHVQAGTYEMHFAPLGSFYVQSASSGSTNLLREKLTVAPGAEVEPIEIVLRDDFATIEGKIPHDSKVKPAVVVVISEESPQQTRSTTVQETIDGYSFSVRLAPGVYKLLAVDRIDSFAYREPEVVQAYSSKMKEVRIEANGKANVDLEAVSVESQVR